MKNNTKKILFRKQSYRARGNLGKQIADERKKNWIKTIENLIMTQNSSKAWKLLKYLNYEKTHTKEYLNITPKPMKISRTHTHLYWMSYKWL